MKNHKITCGRKIINKKNFETISIKNILRIENFSNFFLINSLFDIKRKSRKMY